MGLGLGVIAFTLLLLPLVLNVVRGGAAGVGVDPRREGSGLIFAVTWEEGLESGPLDGRLLVVVARDSSPEPRFRVEAGPDGQQIFGVDVEGWRAGTPVELTDTVFGFPLSSLALIPPGDYWVQGVFDRYQALSAGSAPSLMLPWRQHDFPWNRAPGNLVSRPVRARIDPRSDDVIRVDLSRRVPDPPAFRETTASQHVRVESELLSRFWGREVFLEATVRLPPGWHESPGAHYPLIAVLGAGGVEGEDGETGLASGLVVGLRQGSPYFPGFLPVNSQNLGPWADALLHELIPEVEARFRGVGEPWARVLYGADGGGGWLALAALLSHPEAYGGVWAPCSRPLRVEEYAGMSLLAEGNAYLFERAWGRTPRPGWEKEGNEPRHTLEQENHLELVLGTRGRSGGWWDAWQAAYSPRGEDGYPTPAWDKRTGVVDSAVARAWRERVDLARIPGEADSSGLAADLAAKVHIGRAAAGLARTGQGDGGAPCESTSTEGLVPDDSGLERVLPAILAHLRRVAPAGADTLSWR